MISSSLLAMAAMLPSIALSQSLPSPYPTPSVQTTYGNWMGKSDGSVESFLGIPYGQPPVGNLRFAPPVKTTKQYGNYDASSYGANCPQMDPLSDVLDSPQLSELLSAVMETPLYQSSSSTNSSEDCLSLNVQRPVGTLSTAKLPVMLWIYGGAFLFGTTSMYDGTKIVERGVMNGQPVIFASMNYRLNAFGFLPGKEVAADSTTSVNAGLLDQRLAMEWVADYISAFGGDPTKVTLFGESAGAISVGFQMIAYGGNTLYKKNPLFRAAIMESGSPLPVGPASQGQPSFDFLAQDLGCSSASNKIACLRAVPYNTLLGSINKQPGIFSYKSLSLPYIPRTDYTFVPDLPQNLVAQGKYVKIPMITGDQYDEGSILAIGTLNITTSAQLDTYLATNYFPKTTEAQRTQILANYPQDPTQGSPFDSGLLNVLTPQNKRINALTGDIVFQAPRRYFLSFTSKTQTSWSYASRVFRALPLVGTFHSSDIVSVFGESPTDPTTEMQSRWINFATNLNPNVAGYINWPQYDNVNKNLIQFTELGSSIIPDTYRQQAIAYFLTILDSLTF